MVLLTLWALVLTVALHFTVAIFINVVYVTTGISNIEDRDNIPGVLQSRIAAVFWGIFFFISTIIQ